MPEISELVLSMVKPLVEFPDDVRIDVSESVNSWNILYA